MAASAFARLAAAILTLKGRVDALAAPALNVYDQWESTNFSVNAAAAPPFVGAAISSGTTSTAIPAASLNGRNWGGAFMRSSTTANGGYKYQTSSLVSMFFGVKTAKGQAVWRHRTQFTGVLVRFGFHDASTNADAVDGAYFEVSGSTVSAKTSNNSVRTTHGTTYTLSLDIDYLFDIEVNAAATEARFRVYLASDTTTAVMDVTITTNIPNTSARVFGFGIVATESSTTALDMIILYYMGFGTVAGYEAARRSKVGPMGPAGTPGQSAYQLAVAGGFVGTLEEWQASLVPEALPVTLRLNAGDLLWTHDLLIFTAAGPRLSSLTAVASFLGLTVPDTIPGTFGPSDWDAAATAVPGEMTIDPGTLPSDGGDALTAIQYRVNGGAAINLTGTGTGPRVVTVGFTAGVAADIQIRAVNTVSADPANWSATKTRTPAASGGGSLTIVQAPAPVEPAGSWGTVAERSLAAVGTGNSLVVEVYAQTAAGAPTITDSAGGSWGAPMQTYVVGSLTIRYYVRNGVTGNPTWVRATFAGDGGFMLNVLEASGAGAGLVQDAFGSGAQASSGTWNMAFTSTAANVLLVAVLDVENANTPTGTAPLAVDTISGGYQIFARGIFPTAGPNTAVVTIAPSFAGSRSFLALKGS